MFGEILLCIDAACFVKGDSLTGHDSLDFVFGPLVQPSPRIAICDISRDIELRRREAGFQVPDEGGREAMVEIAAAWKYR